MIKSYFAQVRKDQKEIEQKENIIKAFSERIQKSIIIEKASPSVDGEDGVKQLVGMLKSGEIIEEPSASDLKELEDEVPP